MEASVKCQGFNSEDVAHKLWALATLVERQPELVLRLCEGAAAKCEGIAHTLWTLATFNERQQELFSRLCVEAAVKCEGFNSEDIAHTL